MNTAISNYKPIPSQKWLSSNVWPFQSFFVDTSGVDIAVTDVGRGPVLLFVHTGTWSFIWRDLIERLANDFRCVCFDAPANGRSGMLPASEITLDRAAQVTKSLIQKLELWKFTLIVHDLGGISGLAGAARASGRVQGVVAMNTFAWKPDVAMFRFMLRIMGSALIREMDALSGFMGWIGSSGFGAGRHFDEASRRAFRNGSAAGRRRPFHTYMRDALRCDHLYQEIAGALRGGPLARVPFLTIFGEHNDPFGFQSRWKKVIPHVTQHIVRNGNHFPMCDAPDLVAETISSWHRATIEKS